LPLAQSNDEFGSWVTENCYAHWRIWLTLSENVKQAVLPYAWSHTSKLYSTLKAQYKSKGAVAEFHARHNYENIKLSDHDGFDGFITAMTNAAYQFNKEISDTNVHISNHDIAMWIIHALPSPMYTLQMILLEGAPTADKTSWDLDDLRQHVTAAKCHAQTAGLKLGNKLDTLTKPKALMAQESHHRARRIDPTWASWQTCWNCGKVGHIHQRCTALQAKKQAY